MEEISISAFKSTCLGALERVRRTGQPVLVTRRGVPVAQVIPPPPARPKGAFGAMRGTIRELGDIVEPVAADDWEALG